MPTPTHLEQFDEFWKTVYPHRNNKGIGKEEARIKWMKYIKPVDVPLIFQAGKEYAKSRDVKANIGIKDCHRWIRDGKGIQHWREWIRTKVEKSEPVNEKPILPKISTPQTRELNRRIRLLGMIFVTPSTPKEREDAKAEIKRLGKQVNELVEKERGKG